VRFVGVFLCHYERGVKKNEKDIITVFQNLDSGWTRGSTDQVSSLMVDTWTRHVSGTKYEC